MDFLETPRFPDDIALGSKGGSGYSTGVVRLRSGAEQRNVRRPRQGKRWNVGSGIKLEEDVYDFQVFFDALKGMAVGFRFKDWTDYRSRGLDPTQQVAATDQVIATGDALETEFQLIKTYTKGAFSTVRKIFKLVAATPRVALDGVEQMSGWSVDVNTGILTFSSPPAGGAVISAGYEFDTPVRFDTDFLEVTLEMLNANEIPNIPVIELLFP
jgi:uncharacterized protein (TIGR02217 family)